jgi:hypothetical protein
VPEEDGSGLQSRQAHVNGAGAGYELTDGEDETNANAADKDFKAVFLKGLFRYVRLFLPWCADDNRCLLATVVSQRRPPRRRQCSRRTSGAC